MNPGLEAYGMAEPGSSYQRFNVIDVNNDATLSVTEYEWRRTGKIRSREPSLAKVSGCTQTRWDPDVGPILWSFVSQRWWNMA